MITATPLVECWTMGASADIQHAYSTCKEMSVQYPDGKFESVENNTRSTDFTLRAAADPVLFSVAPYAVKGCSKTVMPHAPKTLMPIETPTPGMYKYYVDYGSAQNAVITVQVGSTIGGEGNRRSGPVKHGGKGCCCGTTSDASGIMRPLPIPGKAGFYPQEKSNWCWAAVGETLMQRATSELNSQCTHAQRVLEGIHPFGIASRSTVFDCDAPILNQGIEDFNLDLTAFGYKAESMGPSEIPGRSSAWIVQWNSGGQHAMVLDESRGGYVFGFDPWPVNQGSFFMMRKDDVQENAQFKTSNFYTSIHKS